MERTSYPSDTVDMAGLHLDGTCLQEAQWAVETNQTDILTQERYDKAQEALAEAAVKGYTYVPLTQVPAAQRITEAHIREELPPGIFVATKGRALDGLSPEKAVAVVGTRNISFYGRETVENIVKGLRDTVLVTSFSFGVAHAAIQAALQNKVPVIAVVATGPGECYPPGLRGLMETVASTRGCAVVTPFFPHTDPTPWHFLYRNRITALLADRVIVAESKMKGGAMVTARLAKSFGKDVYAVPGRINDISSYGCNQLIAEGTADIWLPWGENAPAQENAVE